MPHEQPNKFFFKAIIVKKKKKIFFFLKREKAVSHPLFAEIRHLSQSFSSESPRPSVPFPFYGAVWGVGGAGERQSY